MGHHEIAHLREQEPASLPAKNSPARVERSARLEVIKGQVVALKQLEHMVHMFYCGASLRPEHDVISSNIAPSHAHTHTHTMLYSVAAITVPSSDSYYDNIGHYTRAYYKKIPNSAHHHN